MRRTVTVATLGVLAAATTALLGPGADARQHAPDEDRQAGAIEIGTSDEVDAELSYASTRHETFTYPGAGYVKVHFDEWQLAEGDYITVSDPAHTEVHRYEADSDPGWSTSISGDTAVVRLHTFQGLMPDRMDDYGAKIDAVAHEMTPEEKQESHSKDPLLESVCGQDDQKNAVCYESEEPEVFANTAPVARLLIDGTTMCTAWRVGEKNRLLTNSHCFETSKQARDTEVWFNYSCTTCEGDDVEEPVKVRGDEVLATDATYDYTLFTVDDFEAVKEFGHMELADRKPKGREELYIPQHPDGRPTQVAIGSDRDPAGACQVSDPDYDGYAENSDVSYYCDTSFGSSGSPVLSRETHEVIALHHFGGCPNSGVRSDKLLERIGDKI